MCKHRIIITYLASMLLVSCSIYKLDVQQGNVVTQEAVNQLKPGMNKRQVRYIMGSPLLVDVFHQRRWDYVYTNQPGGEARQQRKISLFFEQEVLKGIEGDFKPGELPVEETSKEMMVSVPKRVQQKTIWEKITGLFSWGGDD